MHKFDVKYNFDNYVEYYKFALLKNRYIKDILILIIFIGIGVYWLIDSSENTSGITLPIVAFVFAALFIAMDFATLPMLKKQIRSKQSEIDRTHVFISFNHDEVIYTNLTLLDDPKPQEEVHVDVEESTEVVEDVNESETFEEVTQDENKKAEENSNEFILKYDNFMLVKETTGLFLFYLDRRTVIIIPKTTYVGDFDVASFKEFIKCKISEKRIKFLKEKN